MFFRYCLVAPGFEQGTLGIVYKHDSDKWEPGDPMLIDKEDSREKFITYNQRLASTSTHRSSDVSSIPILLRYLSAQISDGMEDLLPQLFGLTIKRLWEVRIGVSFPDDEFVTVLRDTLTYLRQVKHSVDHDMMSLWVAKPY
ncbi:unnamed protein product [Rhizoctonia solani]|uniref:Uncharacterized protein n=1 Tax=Rhizoctonia solani TaxID=456999 RepID=A0A8H3C5W5_9AGAM|nr:unnamed protein product [Rhizoctonia solani]